MIFDNQKNLIRLKTQFFIIGAVFISLIVASVMSDAFFKVYPLPTWIYVTSFVALFFAIILFRDYLNYNFFYYNDESDKIVFRYYRIRLFERKYKSIEIPKSSFSGYEEKVYFMKQKHDIILIQKIKKTDAKYPPISITALDKAQKKDMLLSLNKYIRK